MAQKMITAEPVRRKCRVPQSASAPGSLQLVSRQNHPREQGIGNDGSFEVTAARAGDARYPTG
jgi:hypothetical protein